MIGSYLLNYYFPKMRWIGRIRGDYSTLFSEPLVNSCFNIKAQVLSFVNSFCRWNRSVTTLLVTCIEMSSQSPEFYLIQTTKTSYISLEKCYTKLISIFWAFGIEFTSFAFITSLVTMTKREAEKLWITYLNESLILPCQWFN